MTCSLLEPVHVPLLLLLEPVHLPQLFHLDSVHLPQLFLHALRRRLGLVCRLYILLYSDQTLLERVEGGRVEHFLLDLCRVGAPRDEEELLLLGGLRGALALVGVLKVEDSVPAVVRPSPGQVVEEVVVVGAPVADLLHADYLLVLDVEYEEAVGLLLLDVIVGSPDLLVNLDSAGHLGRPAR